MEIEIKNVSKKYKKNYVLKNINMHFKSGKIYGFYGKNGSGKSVLLKILCGFVYPTEGKILYNKQIVDKNIYKYNIGALIENPCFFPNISGYENLKILAEIKNRISTKEINDAMEIVNLTNEKSKKYVEYSLGMKQKLGIAQSIMENQEIIYLDEPFNGVDTLSVRKIKKYLIEEKNKGKIIVISSHNIEDLKELTDVIYYFENGMVFTKSYEEIISLY